MIAQDTVHRQQIRVLFIALKFDYGIPERGPSFEFTNFFDTLKHMENIDVILFPFDEVMRQHGREGMNKQLLETVATMNPDICFFFLFTDEISKQTIKTISSMENTATMNWFADDHWRYDGFSRYWAPLFHWVVTTDKQAVDRYTALGHRQVILSQWGVNHFRYRHTDIDYKHNVSFVGQIHSNRKNIINDLDAHGVHVDCWGKGWPNGRLNLEEMLSVFSCSKINLNFTQSSSRLGIKSVAKSIVTRRADDSLRLNSFKEVKAQLFTVVDRERRQIKGRNFEIPGAGGFLLTEYVDGIEQYFVPDKEIVTFNSTDELLSKIQYYLENESERESIRLAGEQRALQEHTLQKRFNDIFKMIFH